MNSTQKVLILASLVLAIFTGCEKEKVEPPSSCFTINTGPTSNLVEASTAKVNEVITLKTCETTAYSAVFFGDTIFRVLKRKFPNQTKDSTNSLGFLVYNHNAIGNQGNQNYGTQDAFGRNFNRAGVLTYSYNEPGTYTITFVASNVGNAGETIKTAISQKTITVTY